MPLQSEFAAIPFYSRKKPKNNSCDETVDAKSPESLVATELWNAVSEVYIHEGKKDSAKLWNEKLGTFLIIGSMWGLLIM